MWIFILLQQSVHMSLGRMFKSRAAIPERYSCVHPKGGNFEEIVCCQAGRNNSVIKLQKLLSFTEIWSKMRTTEGLLKAFQTVEIFVVFQIHFSISFLSRCSKVSSVVQQSREQCTGVGTGCILWLLFFLFPFPYYFAFNLPQWKPTSWLGRNMPLFPRKNQWFRY